MIPLSEISDHDIQASVDILEARMRISKWGNSLAVRLPVTVVEALELKEGDELTFEVATDRRALKIDRDRTREEAIERLRASAVSFPPGFRFSRDEAHERGASADE